MPTPAPTAHPTPAPTDNPTPMPTDRPTNDACDIDYDLDVAIVVSTGCDLSDDDCNTLREFVGDLIEKTSNPDYVTMTLITYNMGDTIDTVSGDRDTLLDAVDGLTCGYGGDSTDYDGALTQAYTVLDGKSSDEQKIVMISFCDPDGDDTCNVPASSNPDSDIEITVVNVATTSGQFSCLVGGTDSENLFEYPTIDEDTLTRGTDGIRDEVCERPTVSPTPAPTGNPTTAPTANPTPAPTSDPTPAPTADPTPAPTGMPTPAPTSDPTPAPTDNPTDDPKQIVKLKIL